VKLDEEEEDDSNASAFYLRHQNRALASELRMIKYQQQRLEQERGYRRSQSSKAVQTLNSLQATWTQMEAALQFGQPPPHQIGTCGDSIMATSNGARASTGSGSGVELIGALLDSLAALGATTPSKRKGRIREEGDDDDSSSTSEYTDVTPGEFMEEGDAQQLDDLLKITDNVSKRATTLQRWIWSLLQRVDAAAEGQPDAIKSAVELQQEVAQLKAKNKTLKAQLKEVATSRDEMSDSDKRVRRGLYRLAAGRVKLKEVLKAIVVSDEDKEAAALWMEVAEPAEPAVVTSITTAPSLALTKGEDGDKPLPENAAQIATLTKQVNDLEQVAQSRDEQIKKVRDFVSVYFVVWCDSSLTFFFFSRFLFKLLRQKNHSYCRSVRNK
jgi:hypothetical protein